MRYLQSTKQSRVESALAVLNDCGTEDHLRREPYTAALIDGARKRAEDLGFHLDEIWLRQPGMTPRRVDTILRSRGIHGVLIPPEEQPLPSIELDWSRLAVVATTTTAQPERLNRVLPDNYFNMRVLMDRILQSGCRRPLLVTQEGLEVRMEYAPSNLYRARMVAAGLEPLPVCDLDQETDVDRPERLRRQVQEHEPDYLILSDVWVRQWIPDAADLPWACFAVKPDKVLGVDQRPGAIGAAAVDVLSVHVIRGEKGLPELPRVLHIRGEIG
jgi:LacI family transcriptional regulator